MQPFPTKVAKNCNLTYFHGYSAAIPSNITNCGTGESTFCLIQTCKTSIDREYNNRNTLLIQTANSH